MTFQGSTKAHSRCDQCAVQRRSICHAADGRAREELNRISHIRTFAAGETVTAEGQESCIVGNVITGVLKLVKTLSDGRQQIVGLLLPSDMVGRVFETTSRFAIEAASDVTLCCFERRAFEALLAREPELEHAMLVRTLDELDAARDWMLLLGCQTVLERIAGFLLILLCRSRSHGNAAALETTPRVTIPIGRRDMAIYLGTTIETISRTVQHMARQGVIRIENSRHFDIVDRAGLIAMSGRKDYMNAELMEADMARASPARTVRLRRQAVAMPLGPQAQRLP
ncbi:helix-turn-helix domain-containing protein [Rhizobium sp. BK251]|uniref:Crp/Fnr family transcriptional regulator n=1 Tax=Rhizobium sp. BK251 TaxID=2512125 RepID=UPI0010519B3C|nr:helix-turn-helix domain-containing protein [Rhizobium sp. BK251]TCL71179.1 Crp/Fnr family transcriptional regulator [Rhizobium sp. BK251]